MKQTHYVQGIYTPIHPQKYKGSTPIVYRSKAELQIMRLFDLKDCFVEWTSESVVIPYIKPTDGKLHRYFVDFSCKLREKNGNITRYLVEYKPFKQTLLPVKTPRTSERTYITAQMNYAINQAKWECAEQYATKIGAKFMVITEKNIN